MNPPKNDPEESRLDRMTKMMGVSDLAETEKAEPIERNDNSTQELETIQRDTAEGIYGKGDHRNPSKPV